MTSINLCNSNGGLHETPIKRNREGLAAEPKTAESNQKAGLTFDDIDAEELFEQFDRIVRITEHEEIYDEEEGIVTKKLHY